MTKEQYNAAHEWVYNIGLCDDVLSRETRGVYYKEGNGQIYNRELPDEVNKEIHEIIAKYREFYAKKLSEI